MIDRGAPHERMKRVFISYVHEQSSRLAKLLAERLGQVHIDAWRDRERLAGGDLLDDALGKAIEGADAVLFLVTRDSLSRAYPRSEVRAAATYATSKSIRLIPVICAADVDETDLPFSLKGIVTERWYEGDGLPDDDARLWRIVCAIKPEPDMVLGAEDTWSQSWRDYVEKFCLGLPLPKKEAAPKSAKRAQRSPQQRPSLDCGREREWVDVETLYSSESHAVAVVTGPVGEAHDHFLRRIQYFLPHEKPRRVEWVNWRPRPRVEGEFCEALCDVLDTEATNLADELKTRLATHNLVLLHDVVDSRFRDAELTRYYREWLPQLLQQVQPQMKLVCVQPIAWRKPEVGPPPNWLRDMTSRLRGWFGDGGSSAKVHRPDEEQEARALAEELMKTEATHLAIPLTEIRDQDVEHFCKRHQFNAAECADIVSWSKRRAAEIDNSEDVLNAVDGGVETILRQRAHTQTEKRT
jgi:TIR domain